MDNYSVWTFICKNENENTLLLIPNYETADKKGQINYRPEKLNFKNIISYLHTNPKKNPTVWKTVISGLSFYFTLPFYVMRSSLANKKAKFYLANIML